MKDCNQCGKCCTKYSNGGLSATEAEVELWETFRPHIAEYVQNGKIWMDPETGGQIELCPWLRKVPNIKAPNTNIGTASAYIYTCDIYYDRPDDCKYYPVTIEQMINDDCEMLEVRDLEDPKQAQIVLDKLMMNSRPSYS